jgi:hypothetical protein
MMAEHNSRNRADGTPLESDAGDYCVLQVSINGKQVGWLAASGDNYLGIAEERVDATAFRFPAGGGYVLPPYGDGGQRGLGISDNAYPQFYLPSGWWSQWKLVRGYFLCENNLQFVGIENPDDPYGSWLRANNALTPLLLTRQTL